MANSDSSLIFRNWLLHLSNNGDADANSVGRKHFCMFRGTHWTEMAALGASWMLKIYENSWNCWLASKPSCKSFRIKDPTVWLRGDKWEQLDIKCINRFGDGGHLWCRVLYRICNEQRQLWQWPTVLINCIKEGKNGTQQLRLRCGFVKKDKPCTPLGGSKCKSSAKEKLAQLPEPVL